MRVDATYRRACAAAIGGRYDEAQTLYAEFDAINDPSLQARIANDRGVLAAVAGRRGVACRRFRQALVADPQSAAARQNMELLEIGPADSDRGVRILIVSLLFNWPSTGGGTIHTQELCTFLTRAGYNVRHLYAECVAFGVGRVSDLLPYDSRALTFTNRDWRPETIRARFHDAAAEFDPDWVIVTDSWNTKPLLCEAVREWPYFIRIAALECVCPLNNVRLLVADNGAPIQCDRNQLGDGAACRRCVAANGRFSGGLHRAERGLAGFDEADYAQRLQRAFAEADGVLVVNPTIAELVRPHVAAVHVVPSGFDPTRFPPQVAPRPRGADERQRVLFAGLTDEFMKGFHVLHTAAAQLWAERQDFEIVITADAHGRESPFTHWIGWQSQSDLPAVMTACDIVAFPTIAQEALGRTAVEAMGCGRPVVACRIGGLPWVVEEGVTGLLFEPGDASDLARQLARLLDDPSSAARMGAAGAAKFEREFTWEQIINRRYRPLLGTPQPVHAIANREGVACTASP